MEGPTKQSKPKTERIKKKKHSAGTEHSQHTTAIEIEQSKDQRTSRGYYHHLETCDQGQQ
jgi:hypothetical protein